MTDVIEEIKSKIDKNENITHEDLLLYSISHIAYQNTKHLLTSFIEDFSTHDKEIGKLTEKWNNSNPSHKKSILESLKKYLSSIDYLDRTIITLFFHENELNYLYRDQHTVIGDIKDEFKKRMKSLCEHYERKQHDKETCNIKKIDNKCKFCQSFKFNGDSFITMENNCIIFKKPVHLTNRRKVHKNLNEFFIQFLLKLFRKHYFSYDLLSFLFKIPLDTCKRMVSKYFKKCCIEMDDCVYEQIFTKNDISHDIEILYNSELETTLIDKVKARKLLENGEKI